MNEAKLNETDTGRVAEGAGWFVLNLAEAPWMRVPGHGVASDLEAPDAPFAEFGIGVHMLWPGEPNGMYHAETAQEGFLVLSGECIAVIEGEERRLRRWDYFHCPAGTNHITVGAGDGPCAILMVGARPPGRQINYPVDATAARHGASVKRETSSPKEAYADRAGPITPARSPWPLEE